MRDALDDIARLERACRQADSGGEMIEAGSAQQVVTAPKLPRTHNHITARLG